jgi:hypothetical protein
VDEDLSSLRDSTDKKFRELEKNLMGEINGFKDRCMDVEKKTLWRIQDCEEMLKKRITQEYVDDSIQGLEEKLTRDILSKIKIDGDRMEKIYDELNLKIKSTESNLLEKIKSAK